MIDPFRRLTTLTPDPDARSASTAGSARFLAHIDPEWTIGTKVHGGVMTALCARAAIDGVRGDPPDPSRPDRPAQPHPLSVTATYLRAPDPGEVSLVTTVIRRGRTATHVDVELAQNDLVAVRASVVLGDLGPSGAAATYVHPPTAMAATPDDSAAAAAANPLASVVNLSAHCEMRVDTDSIPFAEGRTGAPEVRMWVRARAGDEADPTTLALFALMTGDICPPVTMNLGLFGWAPTVQLTTYLRAVPTPGWLRVSNSSAVVGPTWFEEDHTVVDSSGAVVVQSRQLALLPRGE